MKKKNVRNGNFKGSKEVKNYSVFLSVMRGVVLSCVSISCGCWRFKSGWRHVWLSLEAEKERRPGHESDHMRANHIKENININSASLSASTTLRTVWSFDAETGKLKHKLPPS